LPRWITRTTNVLEGSPQMELAQLKIAQSLLSDDNTPLSHSKFLVHEDDRRRRQQLRNEWFTQWNSLANLRAGGVTWAAEQCKNTSREREDVRLTSVCYWSVIHGGGEWFQTRRVQYLSNGTSWLRRGCSKAVWHVEQICSGGAHLRFNWWHHLSSHSHTKACRSRDGMLVSCLWPALTHSRR